MDQSTSKCYIKFLSFFLSFFLFLLLHSLSPLRGRTRCKWSLWASVESSIFLLFYLVPVLLFIHGVGVGVLQLHEIWTVNLLPQRNCTRQASLSLSLSSMRNCPLSWCIDSVEFLPCSPPWHCVTAPVSCSFRRVMFMYCLWSVPATHFDGICRGSLFRGLIHEMGMLTWQTWGHANKLVTWRDAGNGFVTGHWNRPCLSHF